MDKKPQHSWRADPKAAPRAPALVPAKTSEKVAVVSAAGIIDRAGIEALDYLVSRAPDTRLAVIDLTQATHVDYRSTVILVARHRKLKARGGGLVVAAARREVRDVVRSSAGIDLQIFTTVEEATAYLRGEGDVVLAGAGAKKDLEKPRK